MNIVQEAVVRSWGALNLAKTRALCQCSTSTLSIEESIS